MAIAQHNPQVELDAMLASNPDLLNILERVVHLMMRGAKLPPEIKAALADMKVTALK